MSEIKFRGRRKDAGEWVYGYYVRNEHMGVVKHLIITNWAQVYVNSFEVDPATVGQFTGLRDSKRTKEYPIGQEIYEGDIYRITLGKHFWVYEVKRIGGQFGGMLFGVQLYHNISVNENTDRYTYEITTEDAGSRQYVASGKTVEIIGNIYDIPCGRNLQAGETE